MFWLLQLWLNATFEVSLDVKNLDDNNTTISGRRIEGTRLNLLTPNDKNRSDRDAFFAYFLMFAKRYHFNVAMAPFSKRTYGPENGSLMSSNPSTNRKKNQSGYGKPS